MKRPQWRLQLRLLQATQSLENYVLLNKIWLLPAMWCFTLLCACGCGCLVWGVTCHTGSREEGQVLAIPVHCHTIDDNTRRWQKYRRFRTPFLYSHFITPLQWLTTCRRCQEDGILLWCWTSQWSSPSCGSLHLEPANEARTGKTWCTFWSSSLQIFCVSSIQMIHLVALPFGLMLHVQYYRIASYTRGPNKIIGIVFARYACRRVEIFSRNISPQPRGTVIGNFNMSFQFSFPPNPFSWCHNIASSKWLPYARWTIT